MARFICGCDSEEKVGYTVNVVPGPFGADVQTTQRFDKEGYEICPQHSMRLANWRDEQRMRDKNANPTLKVDFDGPDTRDTRDPQTTGEERLANTNGGSHAQEMGEVQS